MNPKDKYHFIVNPAAGTDSPILSRLYQRCKKLGNRWGISVPTNKKDTKSHIETALENGATIIVAYGGDGTIAEVAKIIGDKNIPLGIIPGGTANVFAKDLGIPQTLEESIDLLLSSKKKIKKIDVGMINDHRFIIRVNIGIFAEMVTEVDKGLKKSVGSLAYSIKGIQKLRESNVIPFRMRIDGRTHTINGLALMIANSANIGIPGYAVHPDASMSDGQLDIIVVESNDIGYLSSAAAKTFTQDPVNHPFKHWKGKQITVNLPQEMMIIVDDTPVLMKDLSISILPQSLSVIVPD